MASTSTTTTTTTVTKQKDSEKDSLKELDSDLTKMKVTDGDEKTDEKPKKKK